jgi:EmrB/QacA subfamily drug resistance transporter
VGFSRIPLTSAHKRVEIVKYQWVVLSVTTVGVFMSGLDTRIVLIGLPTIGASLNADLETLLWVTQGYQFALTIGLLLLGRLTDIFGRVKIYNLGFAIFTLGSGLCVFSESGTSLIFFRIIQGIGGSMLIVNSATIITDATPHDHLGFALGVNQIAFRAGAVLGLTVGGILIDLTGWRTIFLLNVPVGIFGTLWAHFRLKDVSTLEPHAKFDYLGLATFTVGLTVLLLGISFATLGDLDMPASAALSVVSCAAFAMFVYFETHRDQPILDMRLFKIRLFSAGNLSQVMFALGFGSLTLVTVLYLQLIRGYDALSAGLLFLPLEISFVAAGPISGRMSDRYGARGFATMGLAILSAAYLLLAFLLTDQTPIIQLEIILIVIGIGVGVYSSPNISSIMGSVPAHRRGIASAVRATLFNSANVVSVGLVAFVITTAIPYATVSGIISGGHSVLTPSESTAFLTGVGRAFIVMAAVTIVGMFASSLRGSKDAPEDHLPSFA